MKILRIRKFIRISICLSIHKHDFGFTFGIMSKHFSPFIQMSFANMWILPKIDRNYSGQATMIGWLIFHFGWMNKNGKEV